MTKAWINQEISHHIVGVWLDSAGPNPGALFADSAEPNAVFSVERGLFVRATHHNVLALREEADTARVKVQLPVLPNLQKTTPPLSIQHGKYTVAIVLLSPVS